MRGIDELDHYELLEVSRDASPAEIERAYRLAQQTYADGSLAFYSVFDNSDAAAIRQRIDEAFRVLSDPEVRAAYDESQPARSAPAPEPAAARPSHSAPEVGFESSASAEPAPPETSESIDDVMEEYDAFEDDGGGEFDGLRLRRARLFRGYELDQITDVTKVSGTHLRNIEEENFRDLPADVYVRGFVTAYAKTIGLDPTAVVPSYMARVQESRSAGQRGRFLARN